MVFKKLILGAACLLGSSSLMAQSSEIKPDSLLEMRFLGVSSPLKDLPLVDYSKSTPPNVVPNFSNRLDKHDNEDRSVGPDPLWTNGVKAIRETSNRTPNAQIIQNWDGIITNSNPPDPCLEVGPNHVIQMTNGSGGARLVVWNKNGQNLMGPITLSSLWSQFSLTGLGDPIVLYDRIADRWFISEFSSFGNNLLIGISTTNDPTGSYYAYEFQTPNFPDYPKYGVWPTGYFCSTNESSGPTIYVMERDAMLAGQAASVQRFTVPALNAFGFQSVTPVDYDGNNLPVANSPALFFRHNDDEAHNPGGSNPAVDFVEYWQLNVNWSVPNNSTLQGPQTIPVSDFDSHLNGYTQFSGIDQPGFQSLDPLREVFMNRMQYLNFGTHESIVGAHLTDVNGTDRAGIRWYEFRRNGVGPWSVFQEGTYSPDATDRWLSTISMDQNGNIALAYAASSSSVFPSLRFTGRLSSDPAGTMTLPEQTIVNGGGSNSSNRYGDYFAMVVDPAGDSTFWFTGQYNPSNSYKVRVAAFTLDDQCNALSVNTTQIVEPTCNGESNGQIVVAGSGGNSGNLFYNINGGNYSASTTFNNLSAGVYTIGVSDGAGCTFTLSNVIVTEPAAISINSVPEMPTCRDDADGVIIASGSGGTAPYMYKLNNQSYTNANTFLNLAAGTYTVSILDAENCFNSEQVVVINPSELIVGYTIVPETFAGSTDGQIVINASGGTGNFEYRINGGAYGSNNTFGSLSAGTNYVVDIKDSNGCVKTIEFTMILSSIEDSFVDANIKLFPNPASDVINLEVNNWQYNEATLRVLSIDGKVLRTLLIKNNGKDWKETISLDGFSVGTYLLSIQTDQEQKEWSFIKK